MLVDGRESYHGSGEWGEHPRHSRTAQKHRHKAPQSRSRKVPGRKRRTKAQRLLAKKYQQVRRQRKDVHHQAARSLVRPDAAICREDRRVANLVRTPQLATSTRASVMRAGAGSQLRVPTRQQAPVRPCSCWLRSRRRRSCQLVANA